MGEWILLGNIFLANQENFRKFFGKISKQYVLGNFSF